jgi:hypothetical protein
MDLYSISGRRAFVWSVFSGMLDFDLLAAIRTGCFLKDVAPFTGNVEIKRIGCCFWNYYHTGIAEFGLQIQPSPIQAMEWRPPWQAPFGERKPLL